MSEKEAITIPEAIGFWQKNKTWLLPTIMGVVGLLGGNVDRITPAVIPNNPDIVKRIDDLDSRVSVLEGKTNGGGIINVN